jgi:hypothetical protein
MLLLLQNLSEDIEKNHETPVRVAVRYYTLIVQATAYSQTCQNQTRNEEFRPRARKWLMKATEEIPKESVCL